MLNLFQLLAFWRICRPRWTFSKTEFPIFLTESRICITTISKVFCSQYFLQFCLPSLKKKKLNGREKKILQCFTRKTEKKKSFLTLLSKSKSFSSLLLYLLLIFVVLSEFFFKLKYWKSFLFKMVVVVP